MLSPSSSQPRLFIVGHSRVARLELAKAFRAEGYEVSVYTDVEWAARVFGQHSPDVVLLGWADGSLGFIERFGGLVPVLLLTEHNVLIDVVRSLRAGAADYLRMPCYFPEILARIERARVSNRTERQITLGTLSLDVASGVARIDGESVSMTVREARILAAMIRCPEHPINRETLLRVAGITHAKPTIVESYIKQRES